ncbi:MAG: molecular chaperone DnaK [Planctomycetota bacterium]
MSKVLGIDLGTTNSVVAVYIDGEPRIIPNATGQRTTPSMIAIEKDGTILVGPAAKNQQVTNPENTVYSMKRFMGRRHEEVAKEEKIVPYQVVGKAKKYVKIRAGGRLFAPQELSGMLLHEIKRNAEIYIGEPVERAVITVPAYFNDAQRQATIDAGVAAGLKVERIINEPTAAALAYSMERRGNRKLVVFDFGGGTFDLSALEVQGGNFRVLAVHGDTHLGGDDFDQRIIDIVADDFRRRHGIDLRENAMALQRLKEASTEAKCQLSESDEARINMPYVCVDGGNPLHLEYTLTRERFEAVCSDLFESIQRACRVLMAEAQLKASDISDVVLVGGSTRIPRVQQLARDVFNTDALDKSINPDEVVALGAATLGGVLQGDLHNIHLMDVLSHSLGIEAAGGAMRVLVRKNTPIPADVSELFTTPRDNQTSVPINVLEGESKQAMENRPLGVFQLSGIRRAPRGVPRIDVKFIIDADGILSVTATDKDTGKSQNVIITGTCGMDDSEMERVKQTTAAKDAQQDERESTLNLRNHAEKVRADIHEWLRHNNHMIPNRELARIEGVMRKLEKKIEKNDIRGIKSSLKRLDEVSVEFRKAG